MIVDFTFDEVQTLTSIRIELIDQLTECPIGTAQEIIRKLRHSSQPLRLKPVSLEHGTDLRECVGPVNSPQKMLKAFADFKDRHAEEYSGGEFVEMFVAALIAAAHAEILFDVTDALKLDCIGYIPGV